MESWGSRLSSAARKYQSALQARSELLTGFEEIDGDDFREKFSCPFCAESFDIVGLCCHIDDEHSLEAKNGVCPVCSLWVGFDMVAHITLQHGNVFKMERKRRLCKAGPNSAFSFLKRELREGNLQSLFGGSSCMISSSNAAPDPLLSSFILPMADDHVSAQSRFSMEKVLPKKTATDNFNESGRIMQPSPITVKDQEEKTKRSEFVQGLLLSTILNDVL